jgi:3',5'-cyclic AMP phosphodiesterase CpdA
MAVDGAPPDPTHVLAHLSDPHLLADGSLLHGRIDTADRLRSCLERVEGSGERIDAIVLSGDLTDTADPAAYTLLRELVEPVAERLGAQLVWTGGNHDERRSMARGLFGSDTDAPQDTVTTVRGLRILAVDTALPGRHDGGLSNDQFDGLARQLSVAADHGTILVMHHPPIVYRSPWMQLLDFGQLGRLRQALAGTDVRAILSGHLHVPTFGTLGAIPVHVAGGVSYADDVGAPRDQLMAIDGAQSWNLVEVHPDQVVASVVPATQHATWPALSEAVAQHMAGVPSARRRDVFATKPTAPLSKPTTPDRREPDDASPGTPTTGGTR